MCKPLGQDGHLELLRTMLLIRSFEERAGELFRQNAVPGFIHLSIGQEASAAGTCSVLRVDDYITSTHRGHGHMIAKGADPKRMFAELLGKAIGYGGGRGGSMHIADFALGILGANGVVGGGFPIITGIGLSIKLRGTDQVGVVFFGDGASNRGPFHEAVNMAAIWSLPIVFVCENNGYASTTPCSYSVAGGSVAARAVAYGIPGHQVDGNDILAVREAVGEAVERARAGAGPSIVENMTYRYRGHFEGDPQKYRPREEIEAAARDNDPIRRYTSYLVETGMLSEAMESVISASVSAEIEGSVIFAQAASPPEPESALLDVYVNPWIGGV